jgi:hypothetical protein
MNVERPRSHVSETSSQQSSNSRNSRNSKKKKTKAIQKEVRKASYISPVHIDQKYEYLPKSARSNSSRENTLETSQEIPNLNRAKTASDDVWVAKSAISKDQIKNKEKNQREAKKNLPPLWQKSPEKKKAGSFLETVLPREEEINELFGGSPIEKNKKSYFEIEVEEMDKEAGNKRNGFQKGGNSDTKEQEDLNGQEPDSKGDTGHKEKWDQEFNVTQEIKNEEEGDLLKYLNEEMDKKDLSGEEGYSSQGLNAMNMTLSFGEGFGLGKLKGEEEKTNDDSASKTKEENQDAKVCGPIVEVEEEQINTDRFQDDCEALKQELIDQSAELRKKKEKELTSENLIDPIDNERTLEAQWGLQRDEESKSSNEKNPNDSPAKNNGMNLRLNLNFLKEANQKCENPEKAIEDQIRLFECYSEVSFEENNEEPKDHAQTEQVEYLESKEDESRTITIPDLPLTFSKKKSPKSSKKKFSHSLKIGGNKREFVSLLDGCTQTGNSLQGSMVFKKENNSNEKVCNCSIF